MNLEPKRILLAEDHYVSRHLLERNLTNWGFEVQGVGDGEAALEILEGENPPAIVLIDWQMPKVDGLEVCRRIRARVGRPFTYVVLLTAKTHKEGIGPAMEAGVDEYVVKPFEPDELRSRLKVARRVVALERKLALRESELQKAQADLRNAQADLEKAQAPAAKRRGK
jgi:DNA-binding response OmpR family regulator